MKKLKYWSMIMLMAMSSLLMFSCGGDDDESSVPPSEYPDNPDPNATMIFKDSKVEAICVANFDLNKDGKITYAEAAAVKDIGELFRATNIELFDELRYFTGLSTIPHRAFRGCTYLTSVTMPNSVTSIGDYAFLDCSGLPSVIIPSRVTSIGYMAFYYCSSLTSVTIPNSVTSIGSAAFQGCKGLTSITIPNSVTTIGGKAFRGCSALTSIIIPHSVTRIESLAFAGCSGLTSVTIPSSVTWIGEGIFSGPSNLVSINVEPGNSNYNSRNNCNAIIETSTNTLKSGCQNTTIPNGVTTIGEYAFLNCSKLTTITIPNSMTKIKDEAFGYCNSLTSIHCKCEIPPYLHVTSFLGSNAYSSATLYVPHGSIQKYKKADEWKLFQNIVEE